MKKLFVIAMFCIVYIIVTQNGAKAVGLDELLQTVQQKNQNYRSTEFLKQAAKEQREAGDLAFSPVLNIEGTKLDDKAPTAAPTFQGDRTKLQQIKVGVSKEFATTGTNASIGVSNQETEVFGVSPTLVPEPKSGTATGTIAISQSLWKNGFGRASRLQREKNKWQEKVTSLSAEYEAQNYLIQVESAYWDYAYQIEALNVVNASLKRAQEFESWTKRRLRDGISDSSDWAQAQSSKALHELQVLNAKDDILSFSEKLRDFLVLDKEQPLPKITYNLLQERPIPQAENMVRIDTQIAILNSQLQGVAYREAEDAVRPDLKLVGSYATNSRDKTMSDAFSNVTDTDKPTTMVGVKFTMFLDAGTTRSAKNAAYYASMSAKAKEQAATLESNTGWRELARKYRDLSNRLETAKRVSDFQEKSAKEEQVKLRRGRSTTATLIQIQDGADQAKLNYIRLLTEKRKLEAQARLFIAPSSEKL